MVLCGHVQLHKYNYLLSESNLHTIQQGPTPRLHLTSSTYTPVLQCSHPHPPPILVSPSALSLPLPHALTLQKDIATVADNVYTAIGSIDQMLTSSCPNLMALEGLRFMLAIICRNFSRYRSTVPAPPIIRW